MGFRAAGDGTPTTAHISAFAPTAAALCICLGQQACSRATRSVFTIHKHRSTRARLWSGHCGRHRPGVERGTAAPGGTVSAGVHATRCASGFDHVRRRGHHGEPDLRRGRICTPAEGGHGLDGDLRARRRRSARDPEWRGLRRVGTRRPTPACATATTPPISGRQGAQQRRRLADLLGMAGGGPRPAAPAWYTRTHAATKGMRPAVRACCGRGVLRRGSAARLVGARQWRASTHVVRLHATGLQERSRDWAVFFTAATARNMLLTLIEAAASTSS